MVEFTILGTSTAIPKLLQSRTAFLIKNNQKEQFLVDCGSRRVLNRVDINSLSKIFISHLHTDHYQYLGFLISKILRKNRRPIELYCLRGLKKYLLNFIRIFTPISNPKFLKITELEIKSTGEILENDHFKVIAGRGKHTRPTLCYSFIFPEGKITYAVDTAAENSNIIKIARDSDYLIHECVYKSKHPTHYSRHGHSTTRGAGIDARLSNSKNLIITHYNTRRFRNKQQMISEIREEFKGRIIIANDMQTFSL